MFRIVRSIPSPKAEPFTLCLAKVGYVHVQEIENPELAAERARHYYRDLWRLDCCQKLEIENPHLQIMQVGVLFSVVGVLARAVRNV